MYTVSVQQGKFTYEVRIDFKISYYFKVLTFRTFKCTQPTSYIPPYVRIFHVYVALNYGSDLNIKRRKQT